MGVGAHLRPCQGEAARVLFFVFFCGEAMGDAGEKEQYGCVLLLGDPQNCGFPIGVPLNHKHGMPSKEDDQAPL